MIHMHHGRLNRRITEWSNKNKSGSGCKNHSFNIKENLRKLGLEQYSDISANFPRSKVLSDLHERLMNNYVADWHNSIDRESGHSGVVRNELRTYRLFKIYYEIKLLQTSYAKFAPCGIC